MTGNGITYVWRDQTIHFDRWVGQPCGVYEYQTRSGRSFFRFELMQSEGAIRIYILDGPIYGARATDGHSTHRIYDSSRGQYFICIKSGLEPSNVPDALTWLVKWAEDTDTYITTGQNFS